MFSRVTQGDRMVARTLPLLPANRKPPASGWRSDAQRVVSILQPVYLPWLGYFEQIAIADVFVVMDDVQYTRHDWRNRNRIKTPTGPVWLTVPVRKHPRAAPIRDIEIDNGQDWCRRHLRSIELNYRRCPHFEPLFSQLSEVLSRGYERLLDLDLAVIELLCSHLEIETPIELSSRVRRGCAAKDKNGRILELCQHHQAEVLYDGAKAEAFIDQERFQRSGIRVVFQKYRHPIYRQAFGAFLSHQSAIDLIMNMGCGAARLFRTGEREGR